MNKIIFITLGLTFFKSIKQFFSDVGLVSVLQIYVRNQKRCTQGVAVLCPINYKHMVRTCGHCNGLDINY